MQNLILQNIADFPDRFFSCVYKKDTNSYHVNVADLPEHNLRTPYDLTMITEAHPYVCPPLDTWYTLFGDAYVSIARSLHNTFPLVPLDETISLMHLTIVKLYTVGKYLHKSLVVKILSQKLASASNAIAARAKYEQPLPLTQDTDDDTPILQLPDASCLEETNQLKHYTEKDYVEDMYNRIKALLRESMTEYSFERLMHQLETHTVSRDTSYQLNKVRKRLGSEAPEFLRKR